MPMVIWWPKGGGRFPMSEAPLYPLQHLPGVIIARRPERVHMSNTLTWIKPIHERFIHRFSRVSNKF